MKHVIVCLIMLAFGNNALADKYVKGYTKKDGTYVQGHTKTSPDSNRYNNKSSESNGGSHRDEYSNYGATNKSNSSYGGFDNDKDGISNTYDKHPESSKSW